MKQIINVQIEIDAHVIRAEAVQGAMPFPVRVLAVESKGPNTAMSVKVKRMRKKPRSRNLIPAEFKRIITSLQLGESVGATSYVGLMGNARDAKRNLYQIAFTTRRATKNPYTLSLVKDKNTGQYSIKRIA